jgi:acyl transferase domain-containing protein
LAKDLNEIVEQTGKMPAGKTIKSFNPPYIVFMFPGQGSQYMNMAKGLYDSIPFFKKELDQCFKITKENAGIDLRGIIFSSNERENEALIDRTDISQLLIFSFEYALSNLLIHYGIKPDAMIGHSIGEYTAACVSGVYSFTDTIRLITSRGELMKRADEGSMLSIPLPSVEVIKYRNRCCQQPKQHSSGGKARRHQKTATCVGGKRHCKYSVEYINCFPHKIYEKPCF